MNVIYEAHRTGCPAPCARCRLRLGVMTDVEPADVCFPLVVGARHVTGQLPYVCLHTPLSSGVHSIILSGLADDALRCVTASLLSLCLWRG
jgi:hypothetical protein